MIFSFNKKYPIIINNKITIKSSIYYFFGSKFDINLLQYYYNHMAKRKIIKLSKYSNYQNEKYEDMGLIRRLERKLDRVNHIMELVRTIVPILLLLLNCIILLKLFNII